MILQGKLYSEPARLSKPIAPIRPGCSNRVRSAGGVGEANDTSERLRRDKTSHHLIRKNGAVRSIASYRF